MGIDDESVRITRRMLGTTCPESHRGMRSRPEFAGNISERSEIKLCFSDTDSALRE